VKGAGVTAEPNVARVAFSWNGLPQYAARLLREAIGRLPNGASVVGSPPDVPVLGMEDALGQPVHWVDSSKPCSWADLGLETPDIFIQSGWKYPAFNALGREVKARGGYVIGLSDANWRGDFRQIILGPVAFRLFYRRYFDAMIVAGVQGARLMEYFGMAPGRVRDGMLGADPKLFQMGPRLTDRPKEILFVGQFIERKNILGLVRAFTKFERTSPGWSLTLCGSGPQRSDIPDHPAITIKDFVQPEDLSEIFSRARFFILPSLSEAWGLVVHEAASCGCALMLSDKIGSIDDLTHPENAIIFKAGDDDEIFHALIEASSKNSTWLDRVYEKSIYMSSKFGPKYFADQVVDLIDLNENCKG
jgi:glycosyltransferase involved in cell wall biosynthesis